MRLWLKSLLGVLVSALLIWWTLRGEDPAEIWAALRSGNMWLLAASIAVGTAGYLVRAWRWRVLLEPLRPNTSLDARFGAISIGFMANNLLPARVGEFVRAYALSRMEKVSMSGAFGTLVVERLLDGVVLLVFLLLPLMLPGFSGAASVASGPVGSMVQGILLILAVLLSFLIVLLVWPARVVRVSERVLARLPGNLARRAVDALEAFLDALQCIRSARVLVQAIVWSFAFWGWHAISFYLGMAAFGIHEGFAAAMFTEAAVGFGVAVPAAPGFIGTFHAAAAGALEGVYGVDAARSLAFAYGYHLGGFFPITLIGLWYARRIGLSLGEMGKGERPVEATHPKGARPRATRQSSSASAEDLDGWAQVTLMPGERKVRVPDGRALLIDAPAKVNLVLRVLDRSASGYHDIETIFQSLELADRLRLELADERGVRLEVEGFDAGPAEQNLVRRAALAYLEAAALPFGLRIRLDKRIPAGAGLGGGSSDAAATLRAMDAMFGGALPDARVRELAASLGADVPFFLCGSALAAGAGRGDRLSPLTPLAAAPVIVALPEVHVSTAAAYEALDRARGAAGASGRMEGGTGTPTHVADWQTVARLARNDFEPVVLEANPVIAGARDALLRTDPLFALLSGSGAAVYAVYADEGDAQRALARLGSPDGVRYLLTRTRTALPAVELTPIR